MQGFWLLTYGPRGALSVIQPTRQYLLLRQTSEDFQPLLVIDFAQESAQGASQAGMDEARVYLQARDKGKPSLVKPRMGYHELRCLEDEVVKEEDIEVQGPGPEGDIPLPCPLLLDGKEKGEEIPGLACPPHL